MTKLIHLKIKRLPSSGSVVRDQFELSPELAIKFVDLVKKSLGEEYKVIASPFDLSIANDDPNNFHDFTNNYSDQHYMKYTFRGNKK